MCVVGEEGGLSNQNMKTGQLGQMLERRTEAWEPRRDLVVLKHSNMQASEKHPGWIGAQRE